jgi:lipopolysaccharide/colanic/teichoic acid biosynthesis glycosyltransferase
MLPLLSYQEFWKRIIDLFMSGILLVILSPLFIIITLVLIIANKGAGAFFLQERIGKGNKRFKIIKFRSMTEKLDEQGYLLPDEDRLMKVGRLIRNTSLDELPQLLNVLKGDMSIIGPRPLLPQYLTLYTPEQARRHEVRPGITGWAQCHGRNAISWAEKFKLDIWYVDNFSLTIDLKIIIITIWKVIRRSDISHNWNATMEAFNGMN